VVDRNPLNNPEELLNFSSNPKQCSAAAPISRDASHEGQILYLKYDPFFDEFRSDPRYLASEKRVG
jgi:hypothetical protein